MSGDAVLHPAHRRTHPPRSRARYSNMDGRGGYHVEVPFAPRRRLAVDFSPARYARAPHADPAVEAAAAARWAARRAANPMLFNGAKFRYAGWHEERDGAVAVLRLGLTDYAEFQGTHSGPDPVAEFGAGALSRPLGNAVFVETEDGMVPFLVRCGGVGEGAGAAVMPGGHPEPGEVVGGAVEGAGESVYREVMDAARREVLEELFVPEELLASVDEMEVLGLVSRDVDLKPVGAFALQVRMSADEVCAAYRKGNVDQEESLRLVMVPVAEMAMLLKTAALPGDNSSIPIMPDHCGCLDLVLQFLKWRNEIADGG